MCHESWFHGFREPVQEMWGCFEVSAKMLWETIVWNCKGFSLSCKEYLGIFEISGQCRISAKMIFSHGVDPGQECCVLHVGEPGTWILIITWSCKMTWWWSYSCVSNNHSCNKFMNAMVIPCTKGIALYDSSQCVMIIFFCILFHNEIWTE